MHADSRTDTDSGDPFRLVSNVLDDKFIVERLVAEGGFGVVYAGTQCVLERPVAIKVLKLSTQLNEGALAASIEKFTLEAKTVARMSHPAIVQVLDVGVSVMPSGTVAPWMAFEWLTGETLDSLLWARRGQGGCSPSDALALLHPVFDVLAYVHEQGIAHRDIKPDNVMVVSGARGLTLRLMDFGIAKFMTQDEVAGSGVTRTRSTQHVFSPSYAAPEQISGARTGPWTDVYALGLILTEVLTDESPYDGTDMTVLCSEVMAATRPTPLKRHIDVGAWEPVLARALALRPEDRFHNAAEFLTALETALPETRHVSMQSMSIQPESNFEFPTVTVLEAEPLAEPNELLGQTTAYDVAPGAIEVRRAPVRSRALRFARTGAFGLGLLVIAFATYYGSVRHTIGQSEKGSSAAVGRHGAVVIVPAGSASVGVAGTGRAFGIGPGRR